LNHLSVRRFDAPLVNEGGAFSVDGDGTVLTTESVLLNLTILAPSHYWQNWSYPPNAKIDRDGMYEKLQIIVKRVNDGIAETRHRGSELTLALRELESEPIQTEI
jgi:Porphyromonas-type peptidyl-arginine deiminase